MSTLPYLNLTGEREREEAHRSLVWFVSQAGNSKPKARMVVNGSRFNGNGNNAYHEDRVDNACTLSHISIPKTEKPTTTVSSTTDYCTYNIKSETVTPGLPGRSGTGFPIW